MEPATPSSSGAPAPVCIAQPDHFYSASSDGHLYNTTKDLRPSDDPNAARGIPVFKPSYDEFKDFERYMEAVQPWGMISGIVKVIPPAEWKNSLSPVKPFLENVRIRHPIEQNMVGISGLFRQQNIEKRRVYSLREWFELGLSDDFRSPGLEDAVRSRAPPPKRARTRRETNSNKNDSDPPKVNAKRGTAANNAISEDSAMDNESTMGDRVSPDADKSFEAQDVNAVTTQEPMEIEDTGDISMTKEEPDNEASKAKIAASRARKQARDAAKVAQDSEFWESFDPDTNWLPPGVKASDYTPDFVSSLERMYWRNCGMGKPALYGADMAGSLFDQTTTNWNVANLPSLLSRLVPRNTKIPGVNTPYLYFGMWRATFAWHVEDMDLFSINYIHWGAPKHWYAVPQSRARAMETVMKQLFPSDKNGCPQFLRHKSYLASPNALRTSQIKPNTLVQAAGEFVITYPRGYHAGFNVGLNCAESVNFALDSWLELGKKARFCRCVTDSVRIDVEALLAEKARREEEERAGLRRPAAAPRQAKVPPPPQPVPTYKPVVKPRPKKRKAEEIEPTATEQPSIEIAPLVKRPRREVSAEHFPCCICVSTTKEGLLPVNDSPFAFMGVAVPMLNGQEAWKAHETCAMIVPETWVDEIDGEKRVFGVDAIIKDRWVLRCSACTTADRKAHGAPVQCTKGKCSKAFHVSCAQEGKGGTHYRLLDAVEKEVLITLDSDPTNDAGQHVSADGIPTDQPTHRILKTIKKLMIDVICAQHNPSLVEAKRKGKADNIFQTLSALPANCRIRIKSPTGVFECPLLSFDRNTETVEVLWIDGTKKTHKWHTIAWGVIAVPTDAASQPATAGNAPQTLTPTNPVPGPGPTTATNQPPKANGQKPNTTVNNKSSTTPKQVPMVPMAPIPQGMFAIPPYPAMLPPVAGVNPYYPVYYQQHHPAMFKAYTPPMQHFMPVYNPQSMSALALAARGNANPNGHPTKAPIKSATKSPSAVNPKTFPLASTDKKTQAQTKLLPPPVSAASKASSETSSSLSNSAPESA